MQRLNGASTRSAIAGRVASLVEAALISPIASNLGTCDWHQSQSRNRVAPSADEHLIRCSTRSGATLPHHVSTQGRLRAVRGGGFGTERSPATIQRRVSAGSITSSISNTDAIEIAFPFS
jgi:hypothetical protein